jgi:peptide/nickel transport system substrate-binding protein
VIKKVENLALQSTPKITILQPTVSLADPHVASDNKNRLSILAALVEALVCRDGQGRYQPALAQSWQVAPDARTWTFHLRQNVSCHNGDILTAADAIASLERAFSPALGGDLGTDALYQSYFKGAMLAALDRYTLRLVTARPMADALDLLVDIPILPQRALADLPGRPSGTGPYRLVEAGPERLVLEAFADYWAGSPSARQFVWQAEADGRRRVERLLAGQADLIAQVPLESQATLQNSAQAKLVTAPGSVCTVFMNNLRSGVCTDRRVRQALNHALNVPLIIEKIMGGAARPLNGPLTELHFGYDPATPPYPYNPAQTKVLLAEAGYARGLELTLDVPTLLPDEAVPLAHLLAEQYAQVGIVTHIREFMDRPGYAHMVKTKQIADACCFDSSPLSTYRCLKEKFHSGVAGPWWQGYANPAVDALLDQAAATVDDRQRQALYRRAYGLIRDDAPWIFLYSPSLAWGVGPRAGRWQPSIDGVIHLM